MQQKRRIIAIAGLGCAAIIAFILLRHYWYQPTYSYVYTDNSRVDGPIIKVVAESRGQIVELPYDTGDTVEKSITVATLKIPAPAPSPAAVVPADRQTPKYIYQNILAPIAGSIVSRDANIGDTVLTGQPLVTIADLNDLWVIANIDENDISRVKPGQRVDIHIDATDTIIQGWVEYIVPTTTSIVQRLNGNSLVVAANTQDVPVKIRFEQVSGYQLYPGLSTEVTIYTK